MRRLVGCTLLVAACSPCSYWDGIEHCSLPNMGHVLSAVTLAPAGLILPVGATVRVAALGHYADGSVADLSPQATFFVADRHVLGMKDGQLSAVSEGTTTVSSTIMGTVASTMVRVSQSIRLDSLTLSPTSIVVTNGGSRLLVATGRYSDGSSADLSAATTFTSSNPAVATVDKIGHVISGSAGTAVVSASFLQVAAATTASVTITPGAMPPPSPTVPPTPSPPAPPTPTPPPPSAASLTSISVGPASVTLMVGQSQLLAATGHYSDGSAEDVSYLAVWTSSAPAVVSMSGPIATGAGSGTASITARLEGMSSAASVTVQPTLNAITISPGDPTVNVGSTLQLTAYGQYSDGTSTPLSSVTWLSSNTVVADATNGLLSGNAAGTTTITATVATASGSLSGTATATVIQPVTLTFLSVSGSVTLTYYNYEVFTCTAHYSDGSQMAVATPRWSFVPSYIVEAGNQFKAAYFSATAVRTPISCGYQGYLSTAFEVEVY
jgi:hypothetical protein